MFKYLRLLGPWLVLYLSWLRYIYVHDCLKSLLFGHHLFFQILDCVDCLRFCQSLGSSPFLNFPRKGEFHRLPRKCQNPLGFDLFSLMNFCERESHLPLVLLVSTSCLAKFPFLSIATAASSARAPRAPRSTCPPAHNTTAAPRIHTSSAPTRGSFWPSCLIQSYCSATTSTNDETGR